MNIMNSKAIIIGYTEKPDKIASSGARISTTAGDSLYIFENASDTEKNKNLIKKVLASGHKTIIEHISFNLAFVNVSAYAEQFMLEFRLASFTVKSRRYVDFGKMGFVTPSFTDKNGAALSGAEKLRDIYSGHMEFLFNEYNDFIAAGVPKEDARFLLPYSYKSNFYCTVNARELYNIINSMIYGRGSGSAEIRALGQGLLEQANEICPYIFEELLNAKRVDDTKSEAIAEIAGEDYGEYSDVPAELLSYTENPEKAVAKAALIGYTNLPSEKIESVLNDKERVKKIIEVIMSNDRPRELEQINLTYRINNITLAAITHFTRHRIQSIIVPPFCDVCKCERYMIPETVRDNGELLQRYKNAYAKTKEVYDTLRSGGLNKYDLSYLYLSGNTIDITTTMNGRELLTFINLRTCTRSQWETRGIAVEMLNLARSVSPELFCYYGPSCYTKGACPEGRMTCGKCGEMKKLFTGSAEENFRVKLP